MGVCQQPYLQAVACCAPVVQVVRKEIRRHLVLRPLLRLLAVVVQLLAWLQIRQYGSNVVIRRVFQRASRMGVAAHSDRAMLLCLKAYPSADAELLAVAEIVDRLRERHDGFLPLR